MEETQVKESSDSDRTQSAGKQRSRKKRKHVSMADRLVKLALKQFRFGISTQKEVFAVGREGPNRAMLLRGDSDVFRARLAYDFRKECGTTPGGSAISDAMNFLIGGAQDSRPEELHTRVAPLDGGVVIDLGDESGQAVVVDSSGWRVVKRSPVIFRHGGLALGLPVPQPAGDIADLQQLLNVSASDWSQLVGWMVAAFLPEIDHPILLLRGVQGSGKTTAAKMLVELLDPSAAPLRSVPRDSAQWESTAGGSWVIGLDNLSHVPQWLSDSLCKAVTGDGIVSRRLYTNGELYSQAFRRVIVLTSIDTGALRDDLAERLQIVDLEGISSGDRRTKEEIREEFQQMRPQLFGALLDALVKVLAELPRVRVKHLPRMADFAKVLAAADAAGVTRNALQWFSEQPFRIATEFVDGDSFAQSIVAFAKRTQDWAGTASELLSHLNSDSDNRPQRGWPLDPARLSGKLRSIQPALSSMGVEVIQDLKQRGQRCIQIKWLPQPAAETSGQSLRTDQHNDSSDGLDAVDGPFGFLSHGLCTALSNPSVPRPDEQLVYL